MIYILSFGRLIHNYLIISNRPFPAQFHTFQIADRQRPLRKGTNTNQAEQELHKRKFLSYKDKKNLV